MTDAGLGVASSYDGDVRALVTDILDALKRRGETVATAESLTGGLVVAELTSVAGSSPVVRGGLAAYATDVKRDVLKVDAGLIAARGVVSAATATEMATRAVTLFASTWAVSTTGVAGPDRQDDRPVGTVYVAVAGPADVGRVAGVPVTAAELALSGSREAIRAETVQATLRMLHARVMRACGSSEETLRPGCSAGEDAGGAAAG